VLIKELCDDDLFEMETNLMVSNSTIETEEINFNPNFGNTSNHGKKY
jgi:hypothetical protein